MSHQEPRSAPRQRVAHVPHVDVMSHAAAEQLAITVHVDMRDASTGLSRPHAIPAEFAGRVAEAIQTVIDDLLPFPGQNRAVEAAEDSEAQS
jgi:hypothetical protein